MASLFDVRRYPEGVLGHDAIENQRPPILKLGRTEFLGERGPGLGQK